MECSLIPPLYRDRPPLDRDRLMSINKIECTPRGACLKLSSGCVLTDAMEQCRESRVKCTESSKNRDII